MPREHGHGKMAHLCQGASACLMDEFHPSTAVGADLKRNTMRLLGQTPAGNWIIHSSARVS